MHLYNAFMSILVTGGHGFIGSHLVRRLVTLGHDVTIVVKPSSNLARIEDVLAKIKKMEGDLLDPESLARAIDRTKPEGIFHLAASNIQSGVTAVDDEVVRANVLGMKTLLDATKDLPYKFFIQTGSFLEYGMKLEPMKESDVCEPAELYSVTKLAATLLAQAAGKNQKKPTLNFRIFTPYGPMLQKGRLVENVIRRALAGVEIPLTQPDVTRDFIFVADIVELLIEGMEKAKKFPGEIFNAGGGQAVTLQELTDEVLRQTGSKSAVRWGAFPRVLYDTASCQADMKKTFEAFSWWPKHDLAAGLRETIRWCHTSSKT